MIFFDCETRIDKAAEDNLHKMYLVQAFYTERTNDNHDLRGKWSIYRESKLFSKFIEDHAYSKATLYLFAHNIFFDLQSAGFFKHFTEWGWKLDFYYDKGLTYILSIRKDDKVICALSTTNYYDFSLDKIGKIVDLPKLTIDFDKSSMKAITIYCKRDVEIIIEAMKLYFTFLEVHDCGRFGLTKASQAMNMYRHSFLDDEIGIHTVEPIIELERAAYIGGRTEAFRIGKLPKSHYISLDINSMYPFVMQKYNLPTKLVDYYDNPSIERITELLKSRCLIIKALIKTEQAAYAVRYNDKIIFPVGTFDCYLTTPGIKKAIENNHLQKVYTVAIYKQSNIFKTYVDKLYPLKSMYKKENNKPYTELVKKMLNSLYGKFGQKKPIIEQEEDMSDYPYKRMEVFDLVTRQHWIETHLMNVRYVEVGEEISNTTLTAIPAHITEYARLLLWEIIEQVGYDNVLYCDTDSIKINKMYLEKVKYKIDDYELGALAIEKEHEEFSIWGAKDYSTEHETKIKGVPKTAKKLSDNTFRYTRFYRQSTHLRKEIDHGVLIAEVTKTMRREYTKGIVQADGKVRPYRIPDDITLT